MSPDEVYISEDVCASVIYESKKAVCRCKEVKNAHIDVIVVVNMFSQ